MDTNNRDRNLEQNQSEISLIEEQLLENESKRKGSISDQFVPVFQKSEELFPTAEDQNDRRSVFKEQLAFLEAREASVRKMLEEIESVMKVLKERNDALNKKEEILNREYLKLMEIEAMYKGTDRLADSLGTVLPALGMDSRAEDERIED